MAVGRFLGGIGAVIWHPGTERYLLLRRAGSKDFGAGVWECVTGRVDQGEGFEEAARREVLEELGVQVTVDFIIGTTHFYRGEATPANELIGVMYRCSLTDPAAVRPSTEHDRLSWLTLAEAQEQFQDDPRHAWLLRTLTWADEMQRALPPELIAAFQVRGFDINAG